MLVPQAASLQLPDIPFQVFEDFRLVLHVVEKPKKVFLCLTWLHRSCVFVYVLEINSHRDEPRSNIIEEGVNIFDSVNKHTARAIGFFGVDIPELRFFPIDSYPLNKLVEELPKIDAVVQEVWANEVEVLHSHFVAALFE